MTLSTNLNQWRNTHAVIEWFNHVKDKRSLSFLVFDIIDFYATITESLLTNALDYASEYISISNDDKEIIMYTRSSLLFDNEKPWSEKNSSNLFDVTMGSYDGAEVCKLAGLFILSKLKVKCGNNNSSIGLYRDDVLAVFRNMGPRSADKTRKIFCDVFKDIGLRIAAKENLKIVNYLDVTLDLSNGKFYPYRKPENPSLYINAQSNHRPSIIKHLP